jgi:prepilin-type N-terminal cleavage/methylation domain-containing protein
MSNRRGFSLVELLVALVMLVIVAGGVYELLVAVQRTTRRQTEISNVTGNLRNGMHLVQNELQEISTASATGASDISAITPTSVTYRAMRGIGETCGVTTTTVKIRQSSYSGRAPDATRDSLLLYQDTDTTKTSDDVWLPLDITAVGAGTCTNGAATASWDLGVTLNASQVTGPPPLIFTPSPVRTYEVMQLGKVTDAGSDWLGIRSNSNGENTLVPVIGPLTTSGVSLRFYDGTNTETSTLSAIKFIKLVLRGITAQRVNTGMGSALGNPTDSMLVHVQLRNSR